MATAPFAPTPLAEASEDIAFRALAPGDAARAAELIRAAFAAQSRRTDPPSSALRETTQTIEAKIAEGGGVAAFADGEMIGLALWREQDGALQIARLSVLPGWRGRRIAQKLIAFSEGRARAMGLNRLSLNVRLALDDNQRLFLRCGFRRVGLANHPGYAEPTIAIMEKPID